LALTNWKFNAWAKYPNWHKDNEVPTRIANRLGLKYWDPFIRKRQQKTGCGAGGGSIDVNGQGTLMTTEECLLSPVQQRNPGLSQAELEKVFF